MWSWFDAVVAVHKTCIPCSLRTAASVHHHPWDFPVDDLLLVVEVEHVDGGHLGRGAARPCGTSGVGVLDQVCVRVLLHEHVLALAGAVVGFVALGRDDPVPAEGLEVDGQRVAAATGLRRVFVAVQAQVPPRALGRLQNFHLQERLLESGGRRGGQGGEKEVVIREQREQP